MSNVIGADPFYGNTADAVVNAGVINTSSGSLNIWSTSFTNIGTINVTGGARVTIRSTVFTNIASGALTGGSYVVDAGSMLLMFGDLPITKLGASLTLSGTGSAAEIYNPSSNVDLQIDASLATIGAKGVLTLLDGRSFENVSAFSDQGLLQLGGGTFTTQSIHVTTTGKILGFGTVTSAIDNNGMIEAKGGVLTMTGAQTGVGMMQIDTGGALELGAASAEVVSFAGKSGTLKLDRPALFSGVIDGLAAGDVIDLAGRTVTAPLALSGSVLTVHTNAGLVTLTFASAPAGSFQEKSDGAKGTDLVFSAGAPAFAQAMASLVPTAASASALVATSATDATPTLLATVH